MNQRVKPAARRRPRARAARHPALVLTALRLFPSTHSLRPAALQRGWMHDTTDRFAYRCLPMILANQAGWVVASGQRVVATWTGGPSLESLVVAAPDGGDPPAASQFGHGILTWDIPFLFRTPRGYNLLVRGPANWWKDGAVALEGLVETDWAVATFTMNWKLTRPGTVCFEPDDPVCMIVPQRRGELEAFRPRVAPIGTKPELARQYRAWARARDRAIAALENPRRPADAPAVWQLHYLRGTSPAGAQAPEHQTKLGLAGFDSTSAPRAR